MTSRSDPSPSIRRARKRTVRSEDNLCQPPALKRRKTSASVDPDADLEITDQATRNKNTARRKSQTQVKRHTREKWSFPILGPASIPLVTLSESNVPYSIPVVHYHNYRRVSDRVTQAEAEAASRVSGPIQSGTMHEVWITYGLKGKDTTGMMRTRVESITKSRTMLRLFNGATLRLVRPRSGACWTLNGPNISLGTYYYKKTVVLAVDFHPSALVLSKSPTVESLSESGDGR